MEGEPKLAYVRGKIVGIVVRVLPAKQKISVVGLERFENAEVLLGAVVGVALLGIQVEFRRNRIYRDNGLYLMRCGWSASAPRRRRRSAS